MEFLSPDIITNEDDQTTYVVEKSNNVAALAGAFQWGPVDEPTLITGGEKELVSKFGIPDSATYKYVLPLIDFFTYSPSAWVVRQVGNAARNAYPGSQSAELVRNDSEFETKSFAGTDFIGRYPGSAANGIIIDIVDSENFAAWEFANSFSYAPLAGEFNIAVVDSTGYWTGDAAKKQKEVLTVEGTATGTSITVFGVAVTIAASDTASTVATKIAANTGIIALFDSVVASGATVTYVEKTNGLRTVRSAPATASGVSFKTQILDPGSLGGLMETFELVNDKSGSKSSDGSSTYWYDVINQRSKYIRAADRTVALSDRTVVLQGGVSDQVINVTSGYQMLKNIEAYDFQFMIAADVTEAEKKAIIDVADSRGDCMPFVAPPMSAVVNNKGNEVAAVKNWRVNLLNKDSNYSFAIDNWGYMYDKYNNVFRWIPATGGTAGIFARSFSENDPWIPPAGFTRGKFKNYTKMAWSADKEQRDVLYPVGVNSIVTFKAEGIVLYGDKTMTQRPSAFSRVNVRWAFIVAKKSVADMARFYLFEINDEYTRAQFVNAVRPFLRNMKNRRAFEDFRVVCNAVNNDGETRLQNKMVVQLLLKPTYSINWVVLNLSAIRPDVAFTEAE